MHDPRIGRFFAVDKLARQYPFNSPYSFSGNRVIDAIELEGLEPWEVKNEWNEEYKAKYREYIATTGGSGDLTRRYTCEDFGVAGLMEFSRDNNLPFYWETESQTFDASSTEWEKGDFIGFRDAVMMSTGASDFTNPNNTTPNSDVTTVQPGSIILCDQGPVGENDGKIDHVQVSTSTYKNGVVTGAQGNTTGHPNWWGYDENNPYTNPSNDQYVGTDVQLWEYNLRTNTYTNKTENKEKAMETIRPRVVEFNFDNMNQKSTIKSAASLGAGAADPAGN